MSLPQQHHQSSGFTLVELLVAIAIFAVMTALGWKVLSHVQTLRERNAQHEQQLFALQQAYQQMLRDSLQMVPITANNNGQIQAALNLNDSEFSFSKAGVIDPLQQGLSPYERIEYRFDAAQKKLYRLKYNGLDQVSQSQPDSSELLGDVEQFEVAALNPEVLRQWPDPSTTPVVTSISNDPNNPTAVDNRPLQLLPRGIRVQLTVAGTEYEWIFSLLDTRYLSASKANTDNSGNNTNNTNNNNNGGTSP